MAPPPHHQQASSTHTTPSTSTTAQTQTQTQLQPQVSHPVLRLRATAPSLSNRRRIQWAEDVVDNEGLGRKRSKVCCIYHRPHPVGESSCESSSSSSSSSDSDSDSDSASDRGGGKEVAAKMAGKRKAKRRKDDHATGDADHEGCNHGEEKAVSKGNKKKTTSRNAYERVPSTKKRKVPAGAGSGVEEVKP